MWFHVIMMLIVIIWLLIIGFLWRKMVRSKLVQGKNFKIICYWFLLHSPLTAFVLYITGPFYYHIFVNPLPPDEKYIEIFQTHRADLETLIKAYYAAPEGTLWDSPQEIQKIKKKAGIHRIDNRGHWMPDLYSVETQRKLLQFDNAKTREGRFALRQHEALKMDIADSYHLVPTPRYLSSSLLSKSLFYIPTVPKISGGKLWPPVSPPQSQDEYERSARRLLPSLTSYPDNWKDSECVYRQLEPQWFIRMCRTGK